MLSLKLKTEIKYLLNLELLLLLFLTITFAFLARVLFDNYILTDSTFFRVLNEQMSRSQILDIISLKSSYNWLNYILIPVFIFLKIFLFAVCLSIGLIFTGREIKFKNIFKLFVASEFILGFYKLFQVFILFIKHSEIATLEELNNLEVLSLYSIIGQGVKSKWLVFLLNAINLSLIIHFLVSCLFLAILLEISRRNAFNILLSTYGTAWLLYVFTITSFLFISG